MILAAIAPLTNIALGLCINTSVFSKLKDFYVMGGNLTGQQFLAKSLAVFTHLYMSCRFIEHFY